MDPETSSAMYQSICKNLAVNISGVAFIDDASLSITLEYDWDPTLSDEENRRQECLHIMGRLQ
jgi:hypothetical protein